MVIFYLLGRLTSVCILSFCCISVLLLDSYTRNEYYMDYFLSWIFVKYLTYSLTHDLYIWLMTCQEVTVAQITVYWLMRIYVSYLWWERPKVLLDQHVLSQYFRLWYYIMYWGYYCVVWNDGFYVLQFVSQELEWKT